MSNLLYPSLLGIKPAVTRTPEWKSEIIEAWSGEETVIGRRQFPRWRYAVSYEVLQSNAAAQDRAQLMAFFNRHRGAGESFLFVDEEDNAVIDQPFGTTDGITRTFQLVRAIDTWIEPVWALIGTPVIKRGGTTLALGSDYTLGSLGQIVLTSGWISGVTLTWSGSYAMRVRFDRDTLPFERFLQGLWQTGSIDLLSKVYSA